MTDQVFENGQVLRFFSVSILFLYRIKEKSEGGRVKLSNGLYWSLLGIGVMQCFSFWLYLVGRVF